MANLGHGSEGSDARSRTRHNPAARHGGAGAHGVYHFLDMGREKYGDCILAEFGDTRILVDGGHRSDFNGQTGFKSIPAQLEGLIGPPPFKIALLIVTHCHSDHIGCLPDMIAEGMLVPDFALVAHEGLGFGRSSDGRAAAAFQALPDSVQRIVSALREEDRSDLKGAELDAFLADAEKLEDRYKAMLATLEQNGTTKVIRYVGGDEIGPVLDAFGATGMKILGPTEAHLLICAHAIAAATEDTVQIVSDAMTRGADASEGDLYRRIVSRPETVSDDLAAAAADRVGKGAALNDQSIVITFEEGDHKVLLAGDMQFAQAEVSGLDDEMTALRQKVKQGGPYRLAKLSHHSSYNGLNEDVYEEFGRPLFVVHTGGQRDAGHPDPGSLKLLKGLDDIGFARTDRNGLITVDLTKGSSAEDVMAVSRGSLNTFTVNRVSDTEGEEQAPGMEPASAQGPGPSPRPVLSRSAGSAVELLFVRIPYEDGTVVLDGFKVEINRGGASRDPATATAQSLTASAGALAKASTFEKLRQVPGQFMLVRKLGAGRQLPKLLFVTQKARLAANVGAMEADQALKMITDAGQQLFDIGMARDPVGAVRTQLSKAGKIAGVVIVGGYDVVPSQRVDVLDAALRGQIGTGVSQDADQFIVWSDEGYGDIDKDSMPELPVTRVPDGRSASLLLAALSAGSAGAAGRYGIRNSARPFADVIWALIGGNQALAKCGPANASGVVTPSVRQPFVYFMLHGSDGDATRFWGEQGGLVEAINVSKLPNDGVGLGLAGCCWGALTVNHKAFDNAAVAPRTTEQSMALSLIKAGAVAFVGCTGSHYSPGPDASFFGGPMHKAFWTEIGNGKAPARALFDAKVQYLAGMPHGRSDPFEVGIERKIYKQFTCLGLGW